MIKVESPKIHGTPDIFKYWCKEKIRENPHWVLLLIKGVLYYTNGTEYDHLCKRIDELDIQIMELEKLDTNKYIYTAESKKIFKLKDKMYKMIREKTSLQDVIKTPKGKEDRTIVMTYVLFKEILQDYNKEIVQMILEGGVLYLGNALGYSRIRGKSTTTANRLTSRKMVDWKKSNEVKAKLITEGKVPKGPNTPEGENWIVKFDISTPYFRWAWIKNKGASHVKNHKLYGFYPSSGDQSNKRKLAERIRNNPMIVNKYEFI